MYDLAKCQKSEFFNKCPIFGIFQNFVINFKNVNDYAERNIRLIQDFEMPSSVEERRQNNMLSAKYN